MKYLPRKSGHFFDSTPSGGLWMSHTIHLLATSWLFPTRVMEGSWFRCMGLSLSMDRIIGISVSRMAGATLLISGSTNRISGREFVVWLVPITRCLINNRSEPPTVWKIHLYQIGLCQIESLECSEWLHYM